MAVRSAFGFQIVSLSGFRPLKKWREYLADHGIGAGPHNIFFRLNWEVANLERVDSERWPGLVNGGMFSPYYRDDYLCIDWRTTGAMIKAHLSDLFYLKGNVGIKLQREGVYYRPGITYGKRSDRFNARHVLPAAHDSELQRHRSLSESSQ